MKPQDRKKLKARLGQGSSFKGLPEEMQGEIVDRLVPRSFDKGRVIATQGSPPKGLHAVLEGRVAWRRTTAAGDKALLYVAGPGSWFGQTALIRNTPMQFEVSAHTDVHTVMLPYRDYVQLVDTNSGYHKQIADQALERFELLIRLYAENLTLAADDLIPVRLATLAEMRRAESDQRGGPVDLEVSQGDLASMVGVSRQTFNGALKRLEAKGLVELGFRRLRIPDPARLLSAEVRARSSAKRTKRRS